MKKLICIAFALVLFTCCVLANEEFDLSPLIENAPQAVSDTVSSYEQAQNLLNFENIINFITGNFLSSLKENISLICTMLGIMVIMGVYQSLSSSFSFEVSAVSDFACAAILVVLICKPLFNSINEMSLSINDMANYIGISVPILASVLVAGGNVTSASLMNLFLYNGSAYIANIFSSFALPLCSSYLALGIASCVSSNSAVENLTKTFKETVNKLIIGASTLFTGLLSLQNILGKSADLLSKKAVKLAVGSALPLGGSVLAESVDAFWASLGLIKGAGGIIAICSVFYFFAIPFINALVSFYAIKICVLISALLGIKSAGAILNTIADAYSMVLVAFFAVALIFIIAIGMLLVLGGGS